MQGNAIAGGIVCLKNRGPHSKIAAACVIWAGLGGGPATTIKAPCVICAAGGGGVASAIKAPCVICPAIMPPD